MVLMYMQVTQPHATLVLVAGLDEAASTGGRQRTRFWLRAWCPVKCCCEAITFLSNIQFTEFISIFKIRGPLTLSGVATPPHRTPGSISHPQVKTPPVCRPGGSDCT